MCFTSCQKEEDGTTTFKARLESNEGKIELRDDGYFNWSNSDRVDINGQTFTVIPNTNNTTSATLTGPSVGGGPYTAIYPASIFDNAQFTLPTHQHTATGNLQDFPMRAVSNNHELQFYNLCSALRVRMPACDYAISRIEVVSSSNTISGKCTIVERNTYYSNGGHPCAQTNMTNNGGSKRVTLDISNPQTYSSPHDFYITVPAGWYQTLLTFYFFNHEGLVCTRTLDARTNGFALNRSQMTTLDFDSDIPIQFEEGTAHLREFAFVRRENITKIVFHYNSDEYSEEHVEAENSIPIYLKMNGTECHVHTLASFIECPSNCQSLFANCQSLQTIEFGDGFRTNNVTGMYRMFDACQSLTSIDLSSFNTSHVTTFEEMFKDCHNLSSLDLTAFDFQNITTMSNMFATCTTLTSIIFPNNINTVNLTNLQFTFYRCESLTSLDLTHFNTANVSSMKSMLNRCNSLTRIDLSNFTSATSLSIENMFQQSGLREIRLSQSFSPAIVTRACNGLGTQTEHCHIYCSPTLASQLRTDGEASETVEFHTTTTE